jgi:hypothetical protein
MHQSIERITNSAEQQQQLHSTASFNNVVAAQ